MRGINTYVTYEEVKDMEDVQFIDVRSPVEYAAASIPGAANIPLYTEEERHQLGKTYKDEGAAPARMLGLKLVSPKLPRLVEDILAACGGKTPLLYCWRGGTRSESVAAILQLLRIPTYRLQGGYKGYRRFVHHRLQDYSLKPRPVVLHGLTGVGKTRILTILKEAGCPVLDLEGLALHRGSVFGSLGIKGTRSQKDFEGLLLRELEKYQESPYLLVEGEGQKIGPIFVPPFLVEAMKEGLHILLEASLETRVERILKEYVQGRGTIVEDAAEALTHIHRRLGKETSARIRNFLETGDTREAVKELCQNYYDRLYLDSRKENGCYADVIEAEDIGRAVESIKTFLARTFPSPDRACGEGGG